MGVLLTGGVVVLALVALLGGGLAALAILGARLPVEHTATRAATIAAPIAAVFAAIEAVAEHPAWRKDVRSVTVTSPGPDGLAWTEQSRHGEIPFRVVEREAPSRLVVEIATDRLPFAGRWRYELRAMEGDATLVRITEEGSVKPPIFRFLGHHVFGMHRTIEAFLHALAARFGSPASIEP